MPQTVTPNTNVLIDTLDHYIEGIPAPHDHVPDYFPAGDKEKIQSLVTHNLELIDEGYDHYEMLWPSPDPDSIGQSYFAISEKTPLRLEGIGPCLGVVLMNELTGRTLAAHLEARTEGLHDLNHEAEYSAQMVWALFADTPTRIELTSMLGGLEPYHDKVKSQLEAIYKTQIPDYIMSARVDIDPVKRKINTTEMWRLIVASRGKASR